MENKFFLHHISQSGYRNKPKEGSGIGSHSMHLELPDFGSESAQFKKELRQKIQMESALIIKALFPEKQWDDIQKSNYLDNIYEKLNI